MQGLSNSKYTIDDKLDYLMSMQFFTFAYLADVTTRMRLLEMSADEEAKKILETVGERMKTTAGEVERLNKWFTDYCKSLHALELVEIPHYGKLSEEVPNG